MFIDGNWGADAGMVQVWHQSNSGFSPAGNGFATAEYTPAIWLGKSSSLPQSVSTIIEQDLGNSEYFLRSPLNITIEHGGGEYIVSFQEAGLSRSGASVNEALTWLKSSIVELYELYRTESRLGPLPQYQLAVFEKFIGKKQNRARRRA